MNTAEQLTSTYEPLKQTILNRRTVKEFNGAKISDTALRDLLELAIWAPNHHLTEPWTFRVLTSTGLSQWKAFLEKNLPQDQLALTAKVLQKIASVSAIIHVTSKKNESSSIDLENYAATCCAIQNILLGATSKNIQSYWSTSKIFADPATFAFLQIPDSEKFCGAIWLGYGQIPEAKPRKSVDEKTIWIK